MSFLFSNLVGKTVSRPSSSSSKSIRTTAASIPINVLINCILVKERVRPALLVQPQYYQEATSADPKTKKILKVIKKLFPELQHSERYETYQGILISYDDFNGREITLTEMGRILGYPCYADFDKINRDEISFGIDITVHFENGTSNQLITNVCRNKSKLPEFEAIANASKEVLQRPDYAALLPSPVVLIKVTVEQIIPTKAIVNKIINREILTDAIKSQIYNIYFNFSFTDHFEEFCREHFEFNNPVHMGILMSLLLNERNDTLSPFYPLQRYPGEMAEVDEKIKNWESDLMDVILRTKLKPRSNSKSSSSSTSKTRRRTKTV